MNGQRWGPRAGGERLPWPAAQIELEGRVPRHSSLLPFQRKWRPSELVSPLTAFWLSGGPEEQSPKHFRRRQMRHEPLARHRMEQERVQPAGASKARAEFFQACTRHGA